ncbi:MAG: GGDEF domain-containing protein [Lachnospiraceae bacterium]|nr:GGDEF domain-containing protein [Lachnospiraceae bacterium]
MSKDLYDYDINDISGLLLNEVDAVIVVDPAIDSYKTILRRGMFETFLKESGIYHDLILDLWFHFNDSSEKVSGDYQIFADKTGVFKGKYSRRLKLFLEGEEKPHLVQLTVYPFENASKYIFVLDEFIDDESLEESVTTKKINAVQNTYLFSMYIDLVADTTSSINVTEISEDVVNYNLKYSDWRMMIVNMIWPEDQEQFLRRTDPEYLKKNFTPGRTSSYDCMMRNLEGNFIWVKLIFSRAQTFNEEDYRFVFMVQDINDTSTELLSTLQKYEEKAIKDPLTNVYNHGEIELQLNNALTYRQKGDNPVSFMMIDLDHFKEVNDTYGHSAGDTTLKVFANLLREFSAEHKMMAGRWGGEEFVVVCRNKDGNTAYELAEALRKQVEEYKFPEILSITCSIGITEVKKDDTFEGAFDRVDKALYASKKNGRNKVTRL